MCACSPAEKSTTDRPFESRIFPPGDGKVVQFDLVAQPDAVIQVSSKDVQAQRDGTDLVVHFLRVDFALSPRSGKPETELHDVTVRVYKRRPDGGLELLGEADDHSLGDRKLTSSKPRTSVRSVRLKANRVGDQCDQGCVVAVSAGSKDGFSSESAGVEIQLASGQVNLAATNVTDKVDTAPTNRATRQQQVGGCVWLTEAQVSELIGQKMKYHQPIPGSNHCTLVPAIGQAVPVFFSVSDDTGTFYQLTTNPGAEMLGMGDRSVWLPRAASLYVVEGKKMVSVRIGEEGSPPADKRDARTKAEAIARAILTKL